MRVTGFVDYMYTAHKAHDFTICCDTRMFCLMSKTGWGSALVPRDVNKKQRLGSFSQCHQRE